MSVISAVTGANNNAAGFQQVNDVSEKYLQFKSKYILVFEIQPFNLQQHQHNSV